MNPSRILVIRGGAIGDFLMTLPAVGALRARWPEARLEILGYPHITELAQGRYYAQATRSIEARALAGFFVPAGLLEPSLMEYFGGFELVVSYLFDPDQVFGGNLRRCGVGKLIEVSPRPVARHAAEHYSAPLRALDLSIPGLQPRLFPNEEDRAFARRYLGPSAARVRVAIHPGSGSTRKNWPAAKFAAVAHWIAAEHSAELLVIGGEADDAAVAGLTAGLGDAPHRLVRGLRLVELAAVLEQCAAFVGNDSGITHLAAAVSAPTVALFGQFSPAIWEPRGERVKIIHFGEADVDAVQQAVASWLASPGA